MISAKRFFLLWLFTTTVLVGCKEIPEQEQETPDANSVDSSQAPEPALVAPVANITPSVPVPVPVPVPEPVITPVASLPPIFPIWGGGRDFGGNSSHSDDCEFEECSNDSDCEQDNACVSNSCIESKCVSKAIPGCIFCSSASDCPQLTCNVANCVANQCSYTPAPGCSYCDTSANCADNNPCTEDICNLQTHSCANTFIPGCTACTSDDQCCTSDVCINSLCSPCPNVACGDVCCAVGESCVSNTCAALLAGDVFVAPNGTNVANNCQNPLAPCLTIAFAITQVAPNRTIWIFPGTYTEANLTVNKNLTMTGLGGAANTIVQAAINPVSTFNRVMLIQNGFSATLNGLTIQNGGNNIGPSTGGGIFNDGGTLVINNSIVRDNRATTLGGGIAVNTGGSTTINFSTISNNTGVEGGGIGNRGVSLTVNNATFSGNRALAEGGAIYNDFNASSVVLNNSTLSNNRAVSGGGLFNDTGTIVINYTTIANNLATTGGGLMNFLANPALLTLVSTIVAGNSANTGISDPSADCSGLLTSSGYNLSATGTGCNLSGTGDINVAPATVFTTVLGPLQNNGGPTFTHALLVGSPALNQIPPLTNSCGIAPFNQDQRTDIRPANILCDMGSYELQ